MLQAGQAGQIQFHYGDNPDHSGSVRVTKCV